MLFSFPPPILANQNHVEARRQDPMGLAASRRATWWRIVCRLIQSGRFAVTRGTAKAVLGCVIIVSVFPDDARTEDLEGRRSDQLVFEELIGPDVLSENALSVWLDCDALPPEQAYSRLYDWVFPGGSLRNARMGVIYTPYDRAEFEMGGGQLLSLTQRLITTAKERGRLAQLADFCETSQEPPRLNVEDSESCNGLAIRCLLAIASEHPHLENRLEAFYSSLSIPTDSGVPPPDALLVVLAASLQHVTAASIAVEHAERWPSFYKPIIVRADWHRHLAALVAELHAVANTKSSPTDLAIDRLADWTPVARSRARDRGLGFPQAKWVVDGQTVINQVSHDDDFLIFNQPLSGDFEVEGEMGGFGYRDTHLMVGGQYIGMMYDHRNYWLGIPRGVTGRRPIEHELTDTFKNPWIRQRTWIDARGIQTSLNGRIVRNDPVSTVTSPWVALRSTHRNTSRATELRITSPRGNISIPETIHLSDSVGLTDWIEYYSIPESDELITWQQVERTGDDNTMEMVAPIAADLPSGSYDENLIQYLRPIIEDGSISYEFWYEPEQAMVHPAIGQFAFLIEDDGVSVHQVTHGIYERSRLRPDNRRSNLASDSLPKPPPLQPNQWNRVEVDVIGKEIRLSLNGVEIFKQTNVSEAPRHFGLFHYRDLTEARVRHVQWSGDWPKQLPTLAEQSLAAVVPELAEEASLELPQGAVVDLRDAEILTASSISVTGGDLGKHFDATDDGLFIKRTAEQGYRTSAAACNLSIGGDFDITAAFDSLAFEADAGKTATVLMEIYADSPFQDRASLQLKIDRQNDRVVQCLNMQVIEGSERRHYFGHSPEDGEAGRFRLSRRGKQLYYLFAENDSQQFHLIGQAEFTTDDIRSDGVRFGCQIQGERGFTRARFLDLDVRADRLSGLAVQDSQALIDELDRQRDQLSEKVTFDFTSVAPTDQQFYQWGIRSPWRADQRGLRLRSVGTPDWHSTGIALRQPVRGDFDIRIHFDQTILQPPIPGKHSQVFLQLEFDDASVKHPGIIKAGNSQCSCLLTRYSSGAYATEAQIRTAKPDGSYTYDTIGAVAAKDVSELRITRHGTTVTCLATSSNGGEQVIAEHEMGDVDLDAFGVKALVHAGPGSEAQTTLKSITICGDSVSDTVPSATQSPLPTQGSVRPPTPMAPTRPAPTKSWYQRIFDLF